MNRKLTATVWISALALGVVLAGCPKKKPVAVPEEPAAAAPAPAPPPQDVQAPSAPPAVDDTPSPLDADLVTANDYAHKQGLLGDVFFDFDKYNLKPEARERLEKNARFMREHQQFVFTLEGHCDERGTNEYNLALGDRRAHSARDYLVSLGVPGDRLKTLSYGEERPFCNESSEDCWWRNRRAHFVITGKTSS